MESDDLRNAPILQTVNDLVAIRDELLTCAELLREHLFNTDPVGRAKANDVANKFLENCRDNAN